MNTIQFLFSFVAVLAWLLLFNALVLVVVLSNSVLYNLIQMSPW